MCWLVTMPDACSEVIVLLSRCLCFFLQFPPLGVGVTYISRGVVLYFFMCFYIGNYLTEEEKMCLLYTCFVDLLDYLPLCVID